MTPKSMITVPKSVIKTILYVGHIVDFCYVPPSEKEIIKQKLLQGAKDKCKENITFIDE